MNPSVPERHQTAVSSPESNLDNATNSTDNQSNIIKIAILAVGGQGGGVLTNWIIELAKRHHYHAQSTSVAGVAQRTGATLYYIEMARADSTNPPVFSLSPAAGDIDILIAAELMEAGRAIMRGFVTPDRTTLIASTHRVLAVTEKQHPGDGRLDASDVRAAAATASARLISFDMDKIATDAGAHISASLYGALASSGALPFEPSSYKQTIGDSGVAIKANLHAFRAAGQITTELLAATQNGITNAPTIQPTVNDHKQPVGPEPLVRGWHRLLQRVDHLPEPVQSMATSGLTHVVDYQDIAYGDEYLSHLESAIADDRRSQQFKFSVTAAKYLARAMVYDDIIRVADLKTRSNRQDNVRSQLALDQTNLLQVTEYFHPQANELCATLPRALGRWIQNKPKLLAWLDRRISKGRRVRSDRLTGFLLLWFLSGLKTQRRKLLRHHVEMAHLDRWFALAIRHRQQDYTLAIEILSCQRLIKGYADTHHRGKTKYLQVIGALDQLDGCSDAAAWIRKLRESALEDEAGLALDNALIQLGGIAKGNKTTAAQ